MNSSLKGYEEASKCKTCSAAFLRMKELISEYDDGDFEGFYKDFLGLIKNESSDKVLAYVLSVLFIVYKSDKLDANLSMLDHLTYYEKKDIESLLLHFEKKRKRKKKNAK